MIPWYKRFYQVCEGEHETILTTDQVARSLEEQIGTPEEQKSNYIGWSGYAPWVIDIYWGGHFTIKKMTSGPELGTRPLGTGTKINGQITDHGDVRRVKFIATIRLGWFFIFLAILTLANLFGRPQLFAASLVCLFVFLFLRRKSKTDMQEIDIEIYKALKNN